MSSDGMSAYDTIIVGAGSAGCVLANRLSQDPDSQVLLIEAGGEDSNPLIRMPMGVGKTLTDPRLNWYYMTEPEPGNAQRARVWMRGKAIGGSSTINGMMYMRGQPEDYDHWESLGNPGWGWREMGRCFREIENHELGDDGVRGVGGPLHVSIQSHRSPLTEAILQTGAAMGLDRRDDINRPQQEGIAYTPVTIKGGRRCSAADAFLKPIRHRANLTVLIGTQVNRVVFDDRRAVGVEVEQAGERRVIRCRGEVILSAGALHSPKLLQLSGIGPAALLAEHGIPLIHDSPGVGGNMREHKVLNTQLHVKGPWSHNQQLSGVNLYKNALRYFLLHSGVLASTYDITAFIRTDPALARPDAQLTFWSLSFDQSQPMKLEDHPGFMIMGYPLRTESEGSVSIRSADPAAPPVLRTNFLSSDYDCRVIIGMFRYMRRFVAQDPLKSMIVAETQPGPEVQTDEQIIEAARQDETCMHAIGTCRMGQDDKAVVDEFLRVRGVTGLRVMDCSVMPTQVSGNTNGPVMAMAWRAAEQILKDPAPG